MPYQLRENGPSPEASDHAAADPAAIGHAGTDPATEKTESVVEDESDLPVGEEEADIPAAHPASVTQTAVDDGEPTQLYSPIEEWRADDAAAATDHLPPEFEPGTEPAQPRKAVGSEGTQPTPLLRIGAAEGHSTAEPMRAFDEGTARAHPHRPPLLVWLITLVFVSIATMCTFLYPAFSGYNEGRHVDMVYSYFNGNGFYDPGARHVSVGVQKTLDTVRVPSQRSGPFPQVAPITRGERRSFDSYGGDAAGSDPVPNQMVQHPPLYYATMARIMHLVPGSRDLPYDRWVAIIRYLSILMVAPIPILAWASVKTLVGNGSAAVAAAAFPLSLPNLTRIAGNVNNDNLLTLLTACVVLVMAKIIAGDLRKRTGLLVGMLLAAAALTKGTALVLPLVVLLAYLVAWVRHRRRPLAALSSAALVTAAGGAWWWIRNIILFHSVQPDGFGSTSSAAYRNFYRLDLVVPGHAAIGDFVRHYLRGVVHRTWGGIGLPDYPQLSLTVCWAWVGIALVGAILALAFGPRGRAGRASAFLFVLPAALMLALPMQHALRFYQRNGGLPGDEGRYMYPAVTGFALLVGIGYTRLIGRRLAAWLPLVVLVGALATQALAWRALLRTWWVPRDVHGRAEALRQALRSVMNWSPWAHPVTLSPFVAVAAGTVLLLIAAVSYGWANRRDHDTGNRRGGDEPLVTDFSARDDDILSEGAYAR